jgi:molybdate transport system substrate-binding protein
MGARNRWLAAACALLFLGAAPARAEGTLIFAAASLKEALDEAIGIYAKSGGGVVRASYAASSSLAQQIKAGAPADLFMSADRDWMDELEKTNSIDVQSRRDVLRNRLVLIAPSGTAGSLELAPGAPLAAALGTGRLCMADPEHVPAGRYGRTGLVALGLWSSVESRVARADNVRSALAFVARGECPLGVVYATDARSEPKVRIVSTFPPGSHPPVVYPTALTRNARPEARRFWAFLVSPAARPAFEKHGFEWLN